MRTALSRRDQHPPRIVACSPSCRLYADALWPGGPHALPPPLALASQKSGAGAKMDRTAGRGGARFISSPWASAYFCISVVARQLEPAYVGVDICNFQYRIRVGSEPTTASGGGGSGGWARCCHGSFRGRCCRTDVVTDARDDAYNAHAQLGRNELTNDVVPIPPACLRHGIAFVRLPLSGPKSPVTVEALASTQFVSVPSAAPPSTPCMMSVMIYFRSFVFTVGSSRVHEAIIAGHSYSRWYVGSR